MEDNTATMSAPAELNEVEQAALENIRSILIGEKAIPCTACRYCVDCCPKAIPIPDLFAMYNAKRQGKECTSCTQGWKKASDCIRCGKCELACPQNLMIRDLLHQISDIWRFSRQAVIQPNRSPDIWKDNGYGKKYNQKIPQSSHVLNICPQPQ